MSRYSEPHTEGINKVIMVMHSTNMAHIILIQTMTNMFIVESQCIGYNTEKFI